MGTYFEPISTAIVRDGFYLGTAAAVCLAVISILRLFGASGSGALIISSLIALALTSWGLRHLTNRYPDEPIRPFPTAATLIALSLAAFIYGQFPDFSIDGTGYHLPTIKDLGQGWNPLAGPSGFYWSDVYPNGAWSLQATIASWTGNLDSSRVLNLILLLVGSGAMLELYRCQSPEHDPYALIGVAAVIVCPIALQQITLNYIDMLVYYESVTLVASLSLYLYYASILGAVLAPAMIILLIGTKFSGIYFAGLIVAIMISLHAIWHRSQITRALRISVLCAIAGVFAIGIVGYRPYVTNVIAEGQLVTPTMQEMLRTYRPKSFADGNYGQSWPLAVFGVTAATRVGEPEYKWPWQFYRSEFTKGAYGHTQGGFGPFMGVLFCATIIGLIALAVVARTKVLTNPNAVSAVTCLIVGMLFPDAYSARYIPVLWASIGFTMLAWSYALRAMPDWSHVKIVRGLIAAIGVLGIADALVMGYRGTSFNVRANVGFERLLGRISGEELDLVMVSMNPTWRAEETWRQRFLSRGVGASIRAIGTPCARPETLQIAKPFLICRLPKS